MIIGVIIAMDKEFVRMRSLLADVKEDHDGQYAFVTGTFEGKNIVMAKSGIGKVNAAVGVVTMIHRYHPDCVISSGCAGGIGTGLRVMDVVASSQLVYHDTFVGECGEGLEIVSPYDADAKLLLVAKELQQTLKDVDLKIGLICTGDQFITEREKLEVIKSRFPEGLAVDMESCAIAHTCQIMNTPFISLRVISDTIGADVQLDEYKNFWASVADNSFEVLSMYIKSL